MPAQHEANCVLIIHWIRLQSPSHQAISTHSAGLRARKALSCRASGRILQEGKPQRADAVCVFVVGAISPQLPFLHRHVWKTELLGVLGCRERVGKAEHQFPVHRKSPC